ncbi:dual specificity protein phosphatase 1B [Pelomyxa schiedti]|nr:dual specificity protein phosphatase 1B [Pelomyxa schiedti]
MKALTSPQAVTSLTTVELTSCFLVEIPPELAGLRALTSLFLPKNKISVIPDWIVQLPSLKNLEVNYNCIRHVTSSLGEVASLEKLSLVHNKLREFPFEQLGWLPNIQSAFLGLNYLDLTKLSEQERQLSDALCPNISMQRCPQLIIPGLYLGGVITTEDAEELQALGITHILSIGMSPLCGNLPAFAFKKVAVNDLPHEDIKSHFPAANGFISQGIATGGVLVHCAAGQSRSPSFVVAYLMASKRMPYSMALSLVRQKRPCCSPNFGFCKQLQQYAKSLAL